MSSCLVAYESSLPISSHPPAARSASRAWHMHDSSAKRKGTKLLFNALVDGVAMRREFQVIQINNFQTNLSCIICTSHYIDIYHLHIYSNDFMPCEQTSVKLEHHGFIFESWISPEIGLKKDNTPQLQPTSLFKKTSTRYLPILSSFPPASPMPHECISLNSCRVRECSEWHWQNPLNSKGW